MRIAFMGDTLLGGVADEWLRSFGYDHALRGLEPILATADMVVVNQEGPLTEQSRPQEKLDTGRKRYWYRGHPEAAAALRSAGVRVASLANNHVLDHGIDGLRDTMAALDSAGIAHCGAGVDEEQARRPAVVTLMGRRIGFLSCMQRYDMYMRERMYASPNRPGCARLRLRAAKEDLRGLGGSVDLRIVLVHWGRNYRSVTERQRRLGSALAEAGADIVVGHHPHIAQPVTLNAGRPILYSLGNGPLGTPGRFHSGRPPYGLIATIELDDQARISAIELRLIAVDNSQVNFAPVAVTGRVEVALLRSLVDPADRWLDHAGGLRVDVDRRRAC